MNLHLKQRNGRMAVISVRGMKNERYHGANRWMNMYFLYVYVFIYR